VKVNFKICQLIAV